MSTVADSYQSVIRGVSQQAPHQRRSGQMQEEVNVVNDPVRGLARRRGSVLLAEHVLGVADTPASRADVANFISQDIKIAGSDYVLMYRTRPMTVGSTLPELFVVEKSTGAMIPINGADSHAKTHGYSSACTVGELLLLAPKNKVVTSATTDLFSRTQNLSTVWIRGGTYKRTYRLTVTMLDNTVITGVYQTPAAAYDGVLDTSDISATDPEYTKKVNDRVNAYNTEVNQWLAFASAAIQPEAIATELVNDVSPILGGFSVSVQTDGQYIRINDTTGYIKSIEVSDGGDGTFTRVVYNEVQDLSQLSPKHYVNKVVKLASNQGETLAYFIATPVSGDGGWTGSAYGAADKQWSNVVWRECPAFYRTFGEVFDIAALSAGTMYLRKTPAALDAAVPFVIPTFEIRGSGDVDSAPDPVFTGKAIDYLGVFQDRLIIGSGNQLHCSMTSDYFNWYRTSVLSLDATDPINFAAAGSEGDVIRAGAEHDRGLLLFGDKKQYSLSGRQALSAQQPLITTVSAHEGTTSCQPQGNGNLLFFAKTNGRTTTLHQFQFGQVSDTLEAYEVSQQLDTYLEGTPISITSMTGPSNIVLRTTGKAASLYVYTYLDLSEGTERQFDAWCRWRWDPALGDVLGTSTHTGMLQVIYLRLVNGQLSLAVDEFSFEADLSPQPHLDSLRPWAEGLENVVGGIDPENYFAVVGSGSDYFLMGSEYSDPDLFDFAPEAELLAHGWAGAGYDVVIDLTNPYMLDRNGAAINTGRTTIGTMTPVLRDTGGMKAWVTAFGITTQVVDYNGRVVGDPDNLIGRQPVPEGHSLMIPIGRANDEFEVRIGSRRWLPLSITALEWAGQFFNHKRRGG